MQTFDSTALLNALNEASAEIRALRAAVEAGSSYAIAVHNLTTAREKGYDIPKFETACETKLLDFVSKSSTAAQIGKNRTFKN